MKRPSVIFVSVIVLLALLGLGSKLYDDPSGTIKWFIILAAVTALMVFVVMKFSGSSTSRTANQKAYQKAAKQSQKNQQIRKGTKTKDSNIVTYSFNQAKKKPKHRKKSDVHLTVIDGKKGKKKNRA